MNGIRTWDPERFYGRLTMIIDYPISTGPLEGTNNKIKSMQKQAYGFRDMEFFKLNIMSIHQAKYAATKPEIGMIWNEKIKRMIRTKKTLPELNVGNQK